MVEAPASQVVSQESCLPSSVYTGVYLLLPEVAWVASLRGNGVVCSLSPDWDTGHDQYLVYDSS